MNEVSDPLAALRPLHLPEPVTWWPPAPGWWILLIFFLVLLVALVWHWRRGRVRRAALAELRRIGSADLSTAELAGSVSTLLRRYALTLYPPTRVAGLSGEPWLRFLDEHMEGDAFAAGAGRVLIEAPFRINPDLDGMALIELAGRWIRVNGPGGIRHRRRA
ncbi:MAG: DUF4381 domain-containing protein [Pseudomonadota bacterium]|nr:DUF4381 domain-containing protein [Pseudomonadota bacterium]